MKAKIAFKKCNISMEVFIENMTRHSIGFSLSKEYVNIFVYQTLDRLGASVSLIGDGYYVVIAKDLLTINYHE
jgi:hypothetical protein